MPKVVNLPQVVAVGGLISFGGNVDRQAELAVQNAHAACVVDMIVRNEDRIDGFHVPSMQGQPIADLDAANSGIEE